MVSIFKKVRNLTWKQRLLYSEAGLALLLAKLLLQLAPTRWVFRIIGFQVVSQFTPSLSSASQQLSRIGLALHQISLHLPFSTTCLVQAIAGGMMLKRRRLPANLCIGITKLPNGQLAAHAWLTSDHCVVTGGKEQQDYSMIATFLKDQT